MILATLLLLLQLNVPDAASFVGAPKGSPITGEALATRTNEVGQKLRCPVCQGMAISDSPAEMAVNMKAQVRELLSRGYTEEQILQYFELSYGQFVLLEPKFQGVTGAVWLLPVVALLAGLGVLYRKLRRLAAEADVPLEHESTDGEAVRAEAMAGGPVAFAEPDPYLSRVRELVGE